MKGLTMVRILNVPFKHRQSQYTKSIGKESIGTETIGTESIGIDKVIEIEQFMDCGSRIRFKLSKRICMLSDMEKEKLARTIMIRKLQNQPRKC
jgi:hypothetical protein